MANIPTDRSEGFLTRLRGRKVVQWGLVYVAGAWGFLQALAYVSDSFRWPEQFRQIALLALLIGLPIVLVLAWYHGERGQQHISARELAILSLLFLIGGGIFWRYQHATETPSVATPPALTAEAIVEDQSIAVLPFVNMSSNKEQEYFSDGLSEELLNLLAQVPQLRVIARTSSFSFKGKEADIAEIAHKLNVAHVLEGSVRRAGNKIRVTAQLIRAADSSNLWSQTYDRQLTDVFVIQDEISAAVVEQLKIKLLGKAPSSTPTNPAGYALFLQAREISRRYTEPALEQSNEVYRQALSVDSAYAPSWVGLARNYCEQVFNFWRPVDDGLRLAREATDKALAIDANFASAHAVRGLVEMYRLQFAEAARHLERALALEPTNPETVGISGSLAMRLGRLDQAIELMEYAVRRDPLNTLGHQYLAYAYRYTGRLDDGIASLRTMLRLSPEYFLGHEGIGEILLQQGRLEAALAETQRETWEPARLVGLSMVYYALGRNDESNAALQELMTKHEQAWSFNIAYVLAFRGETDRAFEWLEKDARYQDPYLGSLAVYPMFTKIHEDPRWLPLLRRLGMAPEQLAAIKFDVTVPK